VGRANKSSQSRPKLDTLTARCRGGEEHVVTPRGPGRVGILCLLLGFGVPAGALAQNVRAGLFTPAEQAALARDARQHPAKVASRHVRVNLDVLGQLDAPPGRRNEARALRLDVLADLGGRAAVAVLDRIETTPGGRQTWIGHLDGVDYSSVSFVVDRSAGMLTGSVTYPGATFQIRPAADGLHEVAQMDPARFPDDIELEAPAGNPDAAPDAAAAQTDSAARIDVMVLYTPAARTAAGGLAQIEGIVDLAVAETNQGYQNSGIAPRLRLVHQAEVTYTESGDPSTDLNRLTGTSDGFMDGVHALRNQYGADLVALLTNDSSVCGIAWLGQNSASSQANAFSITIWSCATGNYSFGHELGHNQAARHDRFVDNTNSPFTYNHGYIPPSKTWRTVMSYVNGCSPNNCPRILWWSNPDLMNDGEAMGIPEGQANAADNRKTLNTTAPVVANYRQEVGGPPGATTLVAPSGDVSTTTPTMQFEAVTGATWYKLWIGPAAGGSAVHEQWYASGSVCTTTTCSVTLATPLGGNQSYIWQVQTNNDAGYGPWSSSLTFTVTVAGPPAAATPVAPNDNIGTTNPTYTWNTVSAATWYNLLVKRGSTIVVQTWYDAAAVCGASTCSATPAATLTGGVQHTWSVQTWNASGYGPFSAELAFVPPAPTPPAATLVSPSGTSGTTNPTYTWNKVAEATWYNLLVQRGGTTVVQTWYDASAVCGASTCSAMPGTTLTGGASHSWSVQTWNAAGYGPWSAAMAFTPPGVAAPGAPTATAPSGTIGVTSPTYWWNAVSGATWYYVYIQGPGGAAVWQGWFEAGAACGGSTCGATPAAALTNGSSYTWWVRGWNSAGNGAWSSGLTFTPSAALVAAAPIAPSGAAASGSPTFTWSKVSAATWYNLLVRNQSGGVVAQVWYTSASACGASTCAATPSVVLAPGSYTWSVQTYGSSYGPWSASLAFSVSADAISQRDSLDVSVLKR
jgi:hypothetical protein